MRAAWKDESRGIITCGNPFNLPHAFCYSVNRMGSAPDLPNSASQIVSWRVIEEEKLSLGAARGCPRIWLRRLFAPKSPSFARPRLLLITFQQGDQICVYPAPKSYLQLVKLFASFQHATPKPINIDMDGKNRGGRLNFVAFEILLLAHN